MFLPLHPTPNLSKTLSFINPEIYSKYAENLFAINELQTNLKLNTHMKTVIEVYCNTEIYTLCMRTVTSKCLLDKLLKNTNVTKKKNLYTSSTVS